MYLFRRLYLIPFLPFSLFIRYSLPSWPFLYRKIRSDVNLLFCFLYCFMTGSQGCPHRHGVHHSFWSNSELNLRGGAQPQNGSLQPGLMVTVFLPARRSQRAPSCCCSPGTGLPTLSCPAAQRSVGRANAPLSTGPRFLQDGFEVSVARMLYGPGGVVPKYSINIVIPEVHKVS